MWELWTRGLELPRASKTTHLLRSSPPLFSTTVLPHTNYPGGRTTEHEPPRVIHRTRRLERQQQADRSRSHRASRAIRPTKANRSARDDPATRETVWDQRRAYVAHPAPRCVEACHLTRSIGRVVALVRSAVGIASATRLKMACGVGRASREAGRRQMQRRGSPSSATSCASQRSAESGNAFRPKSATLDHHLPKEHTR